MTQLATDNFLRADGAIGALWGGTTSFNAPVIVSHEARCASGDGNDAATTEQGGTWVANQYSEITIGSVVGTVSDNGVGPTVRSVFSGNLTMYIAQSNTHETRIYKVVSGAYTQLGSDGPAVATGDVIRLTANGTTITVTKNGTSIISVTDSSVTTGAPGIWATNSGGRGSISLWAGGDLTAGTPIAVLASSYNQTL